MGARTEPPGATEVLRTVLAVTPECMRHHGIALPTPVVDGGGPSSTFTAAVFGATLAGVPSWGAHVAVRLPDAIFPSRAEATLVGPHIGVFKQVFVNIPGRLLAWERAEALTRTLMASIERHLGQTPGDLLFCPYRWNAGSVKMSGEAKEVNLAAGDLRGLEVAQLNRIEEVGGVKLHEPAYLIVVGVDRIAYALRVTERLRSRRALGQPGDFYPLSARESEALAACQHRVLFPDHLRPGIIEEVEQDLARLEAELGDGRAVCEEDMAAFRRANVALEVLFVTRAIDGALRQYYIGRIAAIAGLLARAFLAHPRATLRLARARAARGQGELLQRSEQLFVRAAKDCAGLVHTVHLPRRPKAPLPLAIRRDHARLTAEGIGHDLPGRIAAADQSALGNWIFVHYDRLGNALDDGDARLPVALAALRTAEQKIVLERDMDTAPDALRTRLSRAALAGASGVQRRQRLQRLVAILQTRGIPMPQGLEALLPYWGLQDLLFCAAVFPAVASTVAQAWLVRHLPHLAPLHAELTRAHPPATAGAQYAWAVVRLEPASRYLLLRAAAHKPLWQDPYGARSLLNRTLLPLWQDQKPPRNLVAALIDEAVRGTDFPPPTCERVRAYLSGKLLSRTASRQQPPA